MSSSVFVREIRNCRLSAASDQGVRENFPSPLSPKESATVFRGEKVPHQACGFLVVCICKAGGGWADSSCESQHPAVAGIHRAFSVTWDIGEKFGEICPVRVGFCVCIELFVCMYTAAHLSV